MSTLSLSKLYGDASLLFKSDINTMWDELEAKTNGNITSDNVASGWATWDQVVLSKDTSYTIGTTSTGVVRFVSSTNEFAFCHTSANDFDFKVGGTTVMELQDDGEMYCTKDIYFYNRSTTYPLTYLVGYQKPVLVYSDSNTINLEQNTTTANTSLIVFPYGPIAVTGDISSTHKFRQLKLDATANGYSSSHTGAADSGLKASLTLNANTWYFVYAVVVQGGDDAGNNYIMVVDNTNPTPSNWGTLNTAYGEGKWVYLGLFRIGFGHSSTTTLVPFINDHQGWHNFTDSGSLDEFFGIKTIEASVVSTSYTTLVTLTAANSGNAAPANCSLVKVTARTLEEGADVLGVLTVTDGSDSVLLNLPSFGKNLTAEEPHGFEAKVPNTGCKLKAKTGA